MSERDFTTTVVVNESPEAAFAAVNNVRGWWSGEIEGDTDKLGAEFTYRYQDIHYSKQRITEFVPGERVVWRVLDSALNFVEDEHEWNGTEIRFDIVRENGHTELRFTHAGLAPQVECYGQCTNAWTFYITESLRNLITSGKGEPNERESP